MKSEKMPDDVANLIEEAINAKREMYVAQYRYATNLYAKDDLEKYFIRKARFTDIAVADAIATIYRANRKKNHEA